MASWKRKYWKKRKEFKQTLYDKAKNNKAYVPMIFQTYRANHHNEHVKKIWYLMLDYPDFKKAYNEELMGKHLCGPDEILSNLHYIDDMFLEYRKTIPEQLAMGDALAVAIRINKENKFIKDLGGVCHE